MFRAERGQSEVIGVVLLLGLTVIVVGSTVALGSVALSDSQATAELQKAEQAMTQVDSKTSLVAHGESTSQVVDIGGDQLADLRIDEDAGWMEIEVETDEETTTENVTLGAIVFEHEGERVAYQGGGVWHDDGDRARMVSPPEFHYRDAAGTETLTLPLVTVREGEPGLHDTVVIRESDTDSERLFPTENGSNPLVGGEVTITVGSEYAEAWGQFFEDRTRADVTEIGENTIEITLQTEIEHPALDASVSSTGQSTLDMGGIERMYADSYDSNAGSYEDSGGMHNAIVQTRDEFRLTAGGGGSTEEIEIRGDTVADSYNIPEGQENKLNVSGEMREEAILENLDPVEGAISQRIEAVRDRNVQDEGETLSRIDIDDGSEHVIENDTYVDGDIDIDDGTLTVTDGATLHVADDVSLTGADATLELDASGGDVDVLVDGGGPSGEVDMDLKEGGSIRSSGGTGDVSVYVDGEIEVQDDSQITTDENTRLELYNTHNVELTDQARIAADGDISRNLWFYAVGDDMQFTGDVEDGIEFTGVFYAPESDAELEDAMTIKGSFTFQQFEFDDANLEFHYDEALGNEQPFEGEEVPIVSYLHVSSHEVIIEDD